MLASITTSETSTLPLPLMSAFAWLKMPGVPPLEWLTHTLERIKQDMDEDQLVALLPCNYKAEL